MAYCTLADIVNHLPQAVLIQLTDDTTVQTAVNEDVLDDHITNAGDTIEAYLRGRYTLPIDPVPPMLTEIAVSLVVNDLYARRPETHDEPPKLWVQRQKEALHQLELMQAGKITLGVSGLSAEDPKVIEIRVNGRRREFGRGRLARY